MSNEAFKSVADMRQELAERIGGIDAFLAGSPSTAQLKSAFEMAFARGDAACEVAQEALETIEPREQALVKRSKELDHRDSESQEAARMLQLHGNERTAAWVSQLEQVAELKKEAVQQLREQLQKATARDAVEIGELLDLERDVE